MVRLLFGPLQNLIDVERRFAGRMMGGQQELIAPLYGGNYRPAILTTVKVEKITVRSERLLAAAGFKLAFPKVYSAILTTCRGCGLL